MRFQLEIKGEGLPKNAGARQRGGQQVDIAQALQTIASSIANTGQRSGQFEFRNLTGSFNTED